jgi:hypothetical protein
MRKPVYGFSLSLSHAGNKRGGESQWLPKFANCPHRRTTESTETEDHPKCLCRNSRVRPLASVAAAAL